MPSDFRPNLHPRDRLGQFRDTFTETDVIATPYRGAGKATGADYFQTTRYKGFEHALPAIAERNGLTFGGIDRVSGVWAGGGEPSAVARLQGRPVDVHAFMDQVGSRYNQDAVISVKPNPEGNSLLCESGVGFHVDADKVKKVIAEVNEGRPEDEQIQGATVRPNGKLEIVDVGAKAQDAIFDLVERLDIGFLYLPVDAELRFKYEDYPDAQGRWEPPASSGSVAEAAREPAREADVEGRLPSGRDQGDVYRAYGFEVPQGPFREVKPSL